VIVQDFQWAGTVGRLDIKIHHDSGKPASVSAYSGRLMPVTAAIPEDPTTAATIKKFWEPIAGKYARKVGEAADDITTIGDDLCEYNLVADAVREKTHADFVMENLGGVRAPYVRGTITYGDMITADPFGNKIVTFKASGAAIKQMLIAVQPAVSGIAYTIAGGKLTRADIGGKPIEDTAVYSGATNSYLAQTLLKDITTKTVTTMARLDASEEYVAKHSPIKPLFDGRRKIQE
jgi:2',3'-cyclic-nucleotide 2'-phosphodiesterase (5'-nucleotidase family)